MYLSNGHSDNSTCFVDEPVRTEGLQSVATPPDESESPARSSLDGFTSSPNSLPVTPDILPSLKPPPEPAHIDMYLHSAVLRLDEADYRHSFGGFVTLLREFVVCHKLEAFNFMFVLFALVSGLIISISGIACGFSGAAPCDLLLLQSLNVIGCFFPLLCMLTLLLLLVNRLFQQTQAPLFGIQLKTLQKLRIGLSVIQVIFCAYGMWVVNRSQSTQCVHSGYSCTYVMASLCVYQTSVLVPFVAIASFGSWRKMRMESNSLTLGQHSILI
eukprot:JP435898.1.p1 GENE.JP435898.1~~JP435898.1.p1  ORF type:complete len:271 (+),score=9.58 JP435898.1:48-860(+)